MKIDNSIILSISELEIGKVYTLACTAFNSRNYVIDNIVKLSDNAYKVDMHEFGKEKRYPGSGNYIYRNNWKFTNNKHSMSDSVNCTFYFKKNL